MRISSMTGFAREAGTTGSTVWAWELKSVNGRGLEIRVRVPPGFEGIGEEARRLIAGSFARGQCQLNLSVSRKPGPPKVRVNREVLDALAGALSSLELTGDLRPASLDGLLAIRGVVEIEEDSGDPSEDAALHADLVSGVSRLIAALQAARAEEGEALAATISGQLSEIERGVTAAEDCPARQPEAIRAKLEAQVTALLSGPSGLDPVRLHQEAALLATRADIREELDRLRAHLDAARVLLGSGEPVGRRLDFLAQEFGRETNTLCAKANDVGLSRIGLALKAVVEQFREQVQNVE